jgi:hypothetical protein
VVVVEMRVEVLLQITRMVWVMVIAEMLMVMTIEDGEGYRSHSICNPRGKS